VLGSRELQDHSACNDVCTLFLKDFFTVINTTSFSLQIDRAYLAQRGRTEMIFMNKKEYFGIMIDCSRNAVISIDALKKFIDLMEKMSYNTLMLYTEETYEIKGEPYFGYLRGHYTGEEIREIDAYCASKNIELVPCIQTLAHINCLTRWETYKPYIDVNDILLIDDERTYALIENMFKSLHDNFSSRLVHIGMDEAEMVGLGQYLKQHGFCDRFEILKNHLEKVSAIAEKYGFKPMMWSDMFFKLGTGEYYTDNPDVITKDMERLVPENISLVYWDYYSTEKNHYTNMIKAHKNFNRPVWFAGGFWSWTGMVPHNGYSIKATGAAVDICMKENVGNMIFTLWGDDGAECSPFALLPSMFYTSQLKQGISDMNLIKKNFKSLIGIDFDDFMLLDLPGINHDDYISNHDKYMLYNDYFLGIYDPVTSSPKNDIYQNLSEKLALLCQNENYGYLFESEKLLCDVLAHKNDIGIRTRKAYKSDDKDALKALSQEYDLISEKIREFTVSFRKAWYKDKKAYGFELQDARLGGLIERTKSCKQRIDDYVNENINKIEELEETLLDPLCREASEIDNRDLCCNSWNNSFINRTGF